MNNTDDFQLPEAWPEAVDFVGKMSLSEPSPYTYKGTVHNYVSRGPQKV